MKQDIFGLGKDSIIYGAGSVITRFVGLFTLPLFTAYLTPSEYGILAMIALLSMVAQPIFSLGLSVALGPSYFEADDIQTKSKAVWSGFAIHVISASMLLLLAWSSPVFLGKLVRLPAEYSHLVSLSLTGTALTILVTVFTQRVQFEKQAKLYAKITVITALVAIIISIYTVVFLGWGAAGMVCGQLAGNLITFLSFMTVGMRATVLSFNSKTVRELLSLGLPLVPSFAFLFILMHSNKYLLEWHSGLDAVGVYSIGFNLGMAISILTAGIATAWYPFFMKYMNRRSEISLVFSKVMTYYIYFLGVICVAFFLFSKPAVILLTAEGYHYAWIVVGFVALANFTQMIFNFFLPNIYYNKDLKYVPIIQGFSVILYLPVSYVLTKELSILGAGISIFFGNLIMVASIFLWNKVKSKSYTYIAYEWSKIFQALGFFSSLVLAYYLLPSFSLPIEFLKSLFIWSISIYFVYVSLQKKEKNFLIKLVGSNTL